MTLEMKVFVGLSMAILFAGGYFAGFLYGRRWHVTAVKSITCTATCGPMPRSVTVSAKFTVDTGSTVDSVLSNIYPDLASAQNALPSDLGVMPLQRVTATQFSGPPRPDLTSSGQHFAVVWVNWYVSGPAPHTPMVSAPIISAGFGPC